MLISGGSADPVSGDKGMIRLAMHYMHTLHQRVKLKVYPDGRHEMLNQSRGSNHRLARAALEIELGRRLLWKRAWTRDHTLSRFENRS